MPPLPPSQSKISTTQLSYAPLHYVLNQRSAPLNCYMSPSTPFSLKGQHHSTVICPPLPPSQPTVSTTQLSYVPHYQLLTKRSASLNCHMPPLPPSQSLVSTTQRSNVSPLSPSPLKVSITQLSHAPSTPFSIKGQHHSSIICLPLSRYPSKCSITQLSYAPSNAFSLKDQHHSTVVCPLSTPFYLKGQHHSTVV